MEDNQAVLLTGLLKAQNSLEKHIRLKENCSWRAYTRTIDILAVLESHG
jgi:hypothetical protein